MTSIAIIGTGFGGLGAAIELKQAGYDDVTIFERADDVGGVWRENTYPGAACDVPSPYYSFSFEPNPRWPRRFSPQPAILDYLRDVTAKYDLKRHIRFNTSVSGADYDESTRRWTVHTSGGDVEADVVISAVGQLSRPSWPNIKGRETFEGASFHSALWDHSVDLTGKRVAVIGTGASAIQFVPEIQPQVAKLSLFQRTPPYIVPRPDTEFSPLHHRVFSALPVTQLTERLAWFGVTETMGVAFLYSKPLAKALTALSRRHMRKQVPDPELRAKLWPSYPVGCKRILFSSNYLPALTEPNVEVITDGISEITATGVRTNDGMLHEVDVIIYGTGFTASDFLAPLQIRGVGGQDLREQWTDGARAYLGMSVPDFPNFFIMYGPNTNLGSGSIVTMLESQASYIRKAIDHARDAGPISVRADVAEEFDRDTQGRLSGSVWSMCSSWYRNASGRVAANWPGTVTEYRLRTARFNEKDYEVA
ncbi:NAD(P)/FAD-dependent oxidoreductase [Skermania sp. ID1734]|uniref:flavin-containing monooxygenase n=1 Tax=Skermania sp. ID1734 TaxID=2597516 RepID=UPI001180BA0A|nr:NAD(P)/FAD-dependent oxidoreductase [Skermania sp. ID1734]TSD94605.1 NAD(P)/FAD-dependent oxidoreductase [Skermania sp. ID1734]